MGYYVLHLFMVNFNDLRRQFWAVLKKLTVVASFLGSTFSFSYRCSGSLSFTILQFFSLSPASVSLLLFPFDDFGGDIDAGSTRRKSGGRLLFGLKTAIEGIVYCGILFEVVDMFSCEPCEEFDLLSPGKIHSAYLQSIKKNRLAPNVIYEKPMARLFYLHGQSSMTIVIHYSTSIKNRKLFACISIFGAQRWAPKQNMI